MKNTKSKSLIFIVFAMLLLISQTLFSACACSDLFRKTLSAPVIDLELEEKVVVWKSVEDAKTYKIYLNNEFLEEVQENATGTPKLNRYNFSQLVTNENLAYKFYVIAVAEGFNNSPKSNEKTYRVAGETNNVESSVKINNQNKVITGLEISDTNLGWNAVDNVSEYYVFIYDNINGERYVTTSLPAINFSNYIVKNEILAFRVGVKNQDDEICFSDTVCYNDALNSVDYGDDVTTLNNLFNTVPLFQGKYFDSYLTSQEEMNQMMYYMFINRIEDKELAISKDYYTKLVNKYGRTDYIYLIGNSRKLGGIGEGTNSFMETCDYSLEFDYDTVLPSRHFYVGFKFRFLKGTNNEPTLVQEKELIGSDLDVGYYNKVSYAKRASNFDNFVSDKNALVQYVTSSEQLYFAVENKITPLFNDNNSSAYKLYNKAKQVLREIISDEMSDYEKALSIFDWICINSVYDNKILSYDSTNVSFTNYTSFSLEGVLNDGLAVCDGYSKTFSLLCNMEGIDTVRIAGGIDSNGNGVVDSYEGLHAWNKVKINDNWYVVDITWSVVDTESDTFSEDGATKYNSNEFLNHMYFLVSDSDIIEHIASDTELNAMCASPESYYYYANETYNGVNNYVIKNQADLDRMVAWMLENQVYGIDVVFDKSILAGTIFNTIIKQTKTNNGIEKANIISLSVGNYMYYTDNNIGAVYSLSLINLHKVNA